MDGQSRVCFAPYEVKDSKGSSEIISRSPYFHMFLISCVQEWRQESDCSGNSVRLYTSLYSIPSNPTVFVYNDNNQNDHSSVFFFESGNIFEHPVCMKHFLDSILGQHLIASQKVYRLRPFEHFVTTKKGLQFPLSNIILDVPLWMYIDNKIIAYG